MRRLSFVIIGMLFALVAGAQHSPHGNQLSIDCSECHTTGNWLINPTLSTFNHANTGFELDGQHLQIDCKMCHLSLNFVDEKGKTECVSCHLDVHQQNLGEDCSMCHTPKSWIVTNINEIHANSRFPLVGSHATADCFECHLSENLLAFRPMGVECIDCHVAEYLATTAPSHQAAGYSTDCTECHTLRFSEWRSGAQNHDFFPLTEGHAIEDCYLCHTVGNFQTLTPDCESCHLTTYNATQNPPHQSLDFPVDCSSCHTTKPGWTPASFDIHNNFYVLEGAHALIATECLTCHTTGYVNTPNTCVGCHSEDYNSTSEPSHVAANFPTDCTVCHTQNAWSPSTFAHSTTFPLTQGHAIADCFACHLESNYQTLSPDCETCHLPDYNTTQDPPHATLDFPVNCLECHTTNPGWTPATFDIHNNYYVLEGAHALIATECAACHANGFVNTPNTCYACHTADYNNTNDPAHSTAGFSTDCEICHTQNAWSPSTYAHSTTFPLTQGHAIADCLECHIQGNYQTLSPDCETCHLPVYNATQDPPHASLDFPVNCLECHTTNPGWTPATFTIHNNYYVLEGSHALIATECTACHSNGYSNTPNTCYGCHSSEYNSTTDPNHAGGNFPTDCTVCHTQNAWDPSTFDHDTQYFPIYSGSHSGEWNSCADCHTTQNNYSAFSCIDCHEHNKTDMDDEHRGESGYVYNSANCLACHPTGRG